MVGRKLTLHDLEIIPVEPPISQPETCPVVIVGIDVAVANGYLDNLKSLVAAVRKNTGVPGLPFFCGSVRRIEDPDDISNLKPKRVSGPYPAMLSKNSPLACHVVYIVASSLNAIDRDGK